MPSRITQGYVSKSIADFPFHQIYSLDDYNNNSIPSVFFGAYRYEDIQIINNHKGLTVVFWTGQDALDHSSFFIKECKHVTAHPKVYDKLIQEFNDVKLVSPASFLNELHPQKLGTKIYAYCPDSAPNYHGKKIIDELRCSKLGPDIIIGTGEWTQTEWRNGMADFCYNEVGIGLCLSDFAGGGLSIIEMGLRGIPVVTNVFNLPNCIPWRDAQDVSDIIDNERSKIGSVNRSIAQSTWDALDHNHYWLKV